jgi:hypothetical protein
MSKLDGLIKQSITKKADLASDENLADRLLKNADRAMGIEGNHTERKGSIIKNLTFTFGMDEVHEINNQVERFLRQGRNVSKSELMRIGLKLIEQVADTDLADLTKLIIKYPRGRKN